MWPDRAILTIPTNRMVVMRAVRAARKAVVAAAVLTMGLAGRARADTVGSLLDTREYYGCLAEPLYATECVRFTGSLYQDFFSHTRFTVTNATGTLLTSRGMLTPTRWLDLTQVRNNYAVSENQGDNQWDFTATSPLLVVDEAGVGGATTLPTSIDLAFAGSTCFGATFMAKCYDGTDRAAAPGAELLAIATPEPGTLSLAATGLLGLAGMAVRRRRR